MKKSETNNNETDNIKNIWEKCIRDVVSKYDNLDYQLNSSRYYYYKPNSIGIDEYIEDVNKKFEYNQPVDILAISNKSFLENDWRLIESGERIVYEKNLDNLALQIIIEVLDKGHYLHLYACLIDEPLKLYDYMNYTFEFVEIDMIEKYCVNCCEIAEMLFVALKEELKNSRG